MGFENLSLGEVSSDVEWHLILRIRQCSAMHCIAMYISVPVLKTVHVKLKHVKLKDVKLKHVKLKVVKLKHVKLKNVKLKDVKLHKRGSVTVCKVWLAVTQSPTFDPCCFR